MNIGGSSCSTGRRFHCTQRVLFSSLAGKFMNGLNGLASLNEPFRHIYFRDHVISATHQKIVLRLFRYNTDKILELIWIIHHMDYQYNLIIKRMKIRCCFSYYSRTSIKRVFTCVVIHIPLLVSASLRGRVRIFHFARKPSQVPHCGWVSWRILYWGSWWYNDTGFKFEYNELQQRMLAVNRLQ